MLLEIEALNLSLREGGRALLRGINLSPVSYTHLAGVL